jgi:tetratricopeptide (TPR) repeat protein
MEGANAIDVLELGDRRSATEDDVTNAYRDISKRFHPDTYFGAPPLVRALAEACFAKVNGAYEALRMPGGITEAKRVLQARSEGRAYVSDRDHQAARVAYKRAEVLFRNRDWRGADALFAEACRLDPTTWPHGLYAARCGYLSRRLTADECVRELDALHAPDAAKRGEVQVAIGNVLKLEGRPAEAVRRYKLAIEADPENRDAQREIRLQNARAEKDKSVSTAAITQPGSPTSVITGLLRRTTDKK